MSTIIIIGSGPSAAGVALALTSGRGRHDITVVDLGHRPEAGAVELKQRLASKPAQAWDPLDKVAAEMGAGLRPKGVLPQKRAFGSDFPFANAGQLDGVKAEGNANGDVISGAYGGFSNVWGAQIMPFSERTFDDWPVGFNEIRPHYEAVLREVPIAGQPDDLEAMFPLLGPSQPLPPVADRTTAILRAYERHRSTVRASGVVVGRARLALRADQCQRCSMCMTGCPWSLIYSASQTFDRLRSEGAVHYRSGMLATRVGEEAGRAFVDVTDRASGRRERLRAEKVFVAAGGLGSTRLVGGSLPTPPRSVELQESVQFALPFVSRRRTQHPANEDTFTLNQFNMVLDMANDAKSLVQIHGYPFTRELERSLPPPLSWRFAGGARSEVLRRLTVGLGYLPSWASPRVRVGLDPVGDDGLPHLTVQPGPRQRPPMLDAVFARLRRVGPRLDLMPVASRSFVAGPAKSYHFGGSFPHADRRTMRTTDELGRLEAWDNIHLVDASVFPTVPATTFTLSAMANAHRIAASAVMEAEVAA